MRLRMISAMGMFVIVILAWLLSTNRRRISWQLVAKGLALQFLMALILFKTAWGNAAVASANGAVSSLLNASAAGTAFVFGPLADPAKAGGFIIFVQFTGSIVFIAALSAGLYHLGVLQCVVAVLSKLMRMVLGTSGSESLAAVVNMFVGQDESALFIRPYLKGLTQSEVMALMTIGMGTIASGVLVTYAGMLTTAGVVNAGGHLLAASILSAPASLVIAKIIVPETEVSQTAGHVRVPEHERAVNLADALCSGASEGWAHGGEYCGHADRVCCDSLSAQFHIGSGGKYVWRKGSDIGGNGRVCVQTVCVLDGRGTFRFDGHWIVAREADDRQ